MHRFLAGAVLFGLLVLVVFFVAHRFAGDFGGIDHLPSRPLAADWVPAAAAAPLDILADDRLEDKNPLFDPLLVDSRPHGAWQVNASAAVLRLDIVDAGPAGPALSRLYPSYAAAAQAVAAAELGPVLPSINSLHGKSKQFDDGLLAAVYAATVGAPTTAAARPAGLLLRLLPRLPANSAAAAWVLAALELGGHAAPSAAAVTVAASAAPRAEFLATAAAVPLGIYAATPGLARLWHFQVFIRGRLPPAVAAALRQAIAADRELAKDYRRLLGFLAGLANRPAATERPLTAPDGAYFVPPMGTPEEQLFARLDAAGALSPTADLIQEFVRAIRSGAVDLRPRPGGGWYDYQLYAFETFLLAERGREHRKLLLTQAYKQRLLEAFKALVAKTRESHAGAAYPAAAAPSVPWLAPRLRVEPGATFYLRVARSYAFIDTVLRSFIAADELPGLYGQREDGPRDQPLAEELASMRQLFYGLYLIACEDIGLAAELHAGELPDPTAAKAVAERYLASWSADRDLAADTRACIPVAGTRSWCTVGVKVLRLYVRYVQAPSIRMPGQNGEWQEVPTQSEVYLLLADEFAELPHAQPLPRRAVRAVADREQSRAAIVAALAAAGRAMPAK